MVLTCYFPRFLRETVKSRVFVKRNHFHSPVRPLNLIKFTPMTHEKFLGADIGNSRESANSKETDGPIISAPLD